MIHVKGIIGIGSVDGTENINIDTVVPETVPAPDHRIKTALAIRSHTVGIVEIPGSVNAQPNQVIILLEECRPGIIDEGAVGLNGVKNVLMRLAVTVCQFNRSPEKVQSPEHRFTALPGDERSVSLHPYPLSQVIAFKWMHEGEGIQVDDFHGYLLGLDFSSNRIFEIMPIMVIPISYLSYHVMASF